MRQISFNDMQDTFLDRANAKRAIDVCHAEEGLMIAASLTNIEQLEAMELSEEDQIRVTVMVFGAFTAGALTAERIIKEEQA